MKIYIATSYANASWAHAVAREDVLGLGHHVTSRWHEPPHRAEALSDRAVILRAWSENRRDLIDADVLLAAPTRDSRETWCEIEHARALDKRIVFVARDSKPNLTVACEAALRPHDVRIVEVYEHALEILRGWP